MYSQRSFSPGLWGEANQMLKGTFDWHIHNGPSVFPRRADDKKILDEAVAAEMAGIGLKAHEGDTAARAKMLDQKTSCRVFGGVCLNHFVGGLNPAAVEASLAIGGKLVWLPTMASRQHVSYYASKGQSFLGGTQKHAPGEGIYVIDKDGRLDRRLYDIFELVHHYKAVLSTGHLSAKEAVALAGEFGNTGSGGVIVMGHPDLINNQAPIEAQIEFARLGGYIEKMVLALHPDWGNIPVEQFVMGMRQIGLERCTVTTDAGGPDRGSSPETLARFTALVLEKQLLSKKELKTVMRDTAKHILVES